jgi:hypothetical protein
LPKKKSTIKIILKAANSEDKLGDEKIVVKEFRFPDTITVGEKFEFYYEVDDYKMYTVKLYT